MNPLEALPFAHERGEAAGVSTAGKEKRESGRRGRPDSLRRRKDVLSDDNVT